MKEMPSSRCSTVSSLCTLIRRCASSELSGSSRSRISGSVTSARAMCDPLLLAPAQLADAARKQRGQVDLLRNGFDLPPHVPFVVALERQPELDVLADVEEGGRESSPARSAGYCACAPARRRCPRRAAAACPRPPLSSPAMMRSSVVLPQPLGPMTATNSPCWTSMSTRSMATTAPKRLAMPRTSRSATAPPPYRAFRRHAPSFVRLVRSGCGAGPTHRRAAGTARRPFAAYWAAI